MWNLFGNPNDITCSQTLKRFEAGWTPFIIDVRGRGEANTTGVVKGTELIQPHGNIGKARREIPKDRDVLLVCRSGGRSNMALETLKRLGFDEKHLFNLKGGMIGWTRSGGPIEGA